MNNYNPNDPTYLCHYGRKGMKWGKNIFEDDNPISSLGNAIGSRISDAANNVGKAVSGVANNVSKSVGSAVKNAAYAIDPKTSNIASQNSKRSKDAREVESEDTKKKRQAYTSLMDAYKKLKYEVTDSEMANQMIRLYPNFEKDYAALAYEMEKAGTLGNGSVMNVSAEHLAKASEIFNRMASTIDMIKKQRNKKVSGMPTSAANSKSKYDNERSKQKNYNDARIKAIKTGHSVYHSDNSGGHYYGVVYDR